MKPAGLNSSLQMMKIRWGTRLFQQLGRGMAGALASHKIFVSRRVGPMSAIVCQPRSEASLCACIR